MSVTLAAIHFIPNRLIVLLSLAVVWRFLFRPVSAGELTMFVAAALFFLFQNYVALKAGLFEFRYKDILLMPYYEPVLWGFYFLGLKRFVSGPGRDSIAFERSSVLALVITSAAFSAFSFDSRATFLASVCSTAILVALFHTGPDLRYALSALVLGLVVELFGVSTGLWWYPHQDMLGLPYWFATMWISVGLLGRRFLIPASELIAGRLAVRGRSGPAR